jgi:hypothetical protein
VLIGFLTVYLFRLIPAGTPVSIPFIGVYHGVERTQEGYRLSHERPQWRFWQHGDQQFASSQGRGLRVLPIFSPTRFSDEVTMRWYWEGNNARRWMLQDSIPIVIIGGREQGFRGYGVKSHYQAGASRCRSKPPTGARSAGCTRSRDRTEAPRTFQIDLE